MNEIPGVRFGVNLEVVIEFNLLELTEQKQADVEKELLKLTSESNKCIRSSGAGTHIWVELSGRNATEIAESLLSKATALNKTLDKLKIPKKALTKTLNGKFRVE